MDEVLYIYSGGEKLTSREEHPDPILIHPINHPTRITNPIKETP